eukprot:g2210.t1
MTANAKVDEKFVNCIAELESVMEHRQKSCASLGSGVFSLARARHFSKFGEIRPSCFPEQMEATCKVRCEKNFGDWKLDRLCPKTKPERGNMVKKKSTKSVNKRIDIGAMGESKEEWIERMRTLMASDEKDEEVSSSEFRDPTKWFGAANIRGLRKSQGKFEKCVEDIVYLAKRQSRLMALVDEYVSLVETKTKKTN